MRTHLVALAVAVAAALPIAPAHADPVNDIIDSFCEVDLCPWQPTGYECPVLATLAPGVPGLVDISPQGDVVLNGWGVYDCPPYGDLPAPPPDPTEPVVGVVRDIVWNLCTVTNCDPLDPWWKLLDPIVCPPLGVLAPGVPGVVDIDQWGDVTVGGTLIWDCPPYGS